MKMPAQSDQSLKVMKSGRTSTSISEQSFEDPLRTAGMTLGVSLIFILWRRVVLGHHQLVVDGTGDGCLWGERR